MQRTHANAPTPQRHAPARIGAALRRFLLGAMLAGPVFGAAAATDPMPTAQDPRLVEVASSDRVVNAVATTPDGRLFVSMPQVEGPGAQVAELKDGKFLPYPNLEWSLWKDAADPRTTLLHVNTVRIGPDGDLWVVDAGGPRVGGKAVPGAAKIVQIDVGTNRIRRIYQADPAVVREYSYFNDIRFNGNTAYISDAAAIHPAVVVLDLASGKMHRTLEDHPSTVAAHAMIADGGRVITLKDPIPDSTGKPTSSKYVNIDQLEVSPDGKWLYFQPIGGPLARVPTALLDDPGAPKAAVAAAVEKVADTWMAAGSAIDAAGNIYMSKVTNRSVMKIAPDGTVSTLVADPRLTWIDAMWVSNDGDLYMPAAQLDRTSANLAGAPAQITYPVKIYRLAIRQKPAGNDHK
ncbi:SMP-30/gluconolactonase/LRE family protein [Cupriavidus sp. 2TAF22]|uniref:SMP-30/gluconolactonase/LRE family protein n=1 Tax=unclassified Cupriavidus TaxID=2640874 RepID=UPI003F8F730F